MKDYFELECAVEAWAEEKGIFEKAIKIAQGNKTLEECNELLEALQAQDSGLSSFYNSKGKLVNTDEEIKDALGDILVTIIIQAKMQGIKLEECLESAYNVISKRKGSMINGQFVKDE